MTRLRLKSALFTDGQIELDLLGETELLVELDASAAAIHEQTTREIPVIEPSADGSGQPDVTSG